MSEEKIQAIHGISDLEEIARRVQESLAIRVAQVKQDYRLCVGVINKERSIIADPLIAAIETDPMFAREVFFFAEKHFTPSKMTATALLACLMTFIEFKFEQKFEIKCRFLGSLELNKANQAAEIYNNIWKIENTSGEWIADITKFIRDRKQEIFNELAKTVIIHEQAGTW
jgi:hypothetical protein